MANGTVHHCINGPSNGLSNRDRGRNVNFALHVILNNLVLSFHSPRPLYGMVWYGIPAAQLKRMGQVKLTLEERKRRRRALKEENLPSFQEYIKAQ